ncbi:amidophosphoribosyltransferase [Candidatus Peregrinibacteria bacterium]|nr:amidophosphoribosyltransferase [Candidatus Peregrinibacteria bacterium]
MCGIVGILGHDYIAQDVYDGLVTLQHRGQDAAGMITYNNRFHIRKDFGLVKDVFHTRHMKRLKGYAGVGHTRYATIGKGNLEEIQPFIGPAPFGVVLAHNGNVFNAYDLKEEIFKKDHRLVNSDSDAEVLLNLFTKALTKQNADRLEAKHIYKAVESVFARAEGAYSVVSYIARQGMIAFRDPYGIRPLLFGKREKGLITDYIFASESVTLDILGFKYIKDIKPGEVVFISEKDRKVHSKVLTGKKHIPCIFEYIYFSRPDSILDSISVYKSRLRMGRRLAKKIKKANLDIDVVMPVPDSSRTAALTLADSLNIKYREGLIKNRYIGRTFIMPGQRIRKKSIKYKLNPMKLEIKGKKILLVDDSIVRGNTSRQIVQMVKDAGAKKVYFCSYSAPIISPCLYGIDIPTKEELIASSNTVDEIQKFIGADALIYEDLKDSFESCMVKGGPKDFCMACFNKKYKTGNIDKSILKKHAEARLKEKQKCEPAPDVGILGEGTESDGQLNLV